MARADTLSVHIDAVTRGRSTCLEQVRVTLEGGAVHAVVGPNGAGKSTLLRAIAGLDAVRGRVRYGEETIVPGPAEPRARRLAWVPQEPSVPSGMTVGEVVGLARAFRGESSRATAGHVERALARVQLEAAGARPFETLSAGQRQRAVIARALATEAPVLLLDEPFSALDIGASLALERMLRELAQGGSLVVVVVHDLAQAFRLAETLHVLARGRLVASGAPQEVLNAERLRALWGVRAHDEALTSFELTEGQ